MKYYVFCNYTHDGGALKEFKTLAEAIEYYKSDSDAEKIIYGQQIYED